MTKGRWSVVMSLAMGAGACSASRENAPGDAGAGSDAGSALADAATSGGVDASTTDAGRDAGPGGFADGVPFSATGPWRYALPATTPLAGNSTALVAAIQADVTKYYGTWAINTDTFSAPYYVARVGTPTQTWTWNCGKGGTVYGPFAASLANVATPIGMIASQGTDGEVAIYSPETDTHWDFWQAKVDANGRWSACYGGKIDHASTDPGIFGQGLGATAVGLPLGGWLIRIDELQAGVIPHALGFQMVSTQATRFSWPASRTDGKTSGADVPMEGQRFRLDPAFDTTTIANPTARIVAKALQDYGMLLTDTSGAVTLQMEDARPYAAAHGGVNPYTALWDKQPSYAVLKEIPLARLQALPPDYGKTFIQ